MINAETRERPLAANGVQPDLLKRWRETAPTITLILLGAFLVSAQFRLHLAIGSTLGTGYQAQPPLAFALIILSGALGGFISTQIRIGVRRRKRFLGLLAALALTFVAFVLLLPELSLLQVLYFVGVALLLGLAIIFLPSANAVPPNWDRTLWQNRALLILWTRYNILSRYSQAVLGILWIVLLPLSTAIVFAFVFSRILRVAPTDVPFLPFFLSGITLWNIFNQGVSRSTTAVLNKLGLISQVYFPRELLIFIELGEIFVDFSFNFVTLVVINLLLGILPNINFLFLPPILLIQVALTLGVMLFVSSLSVIIRDVPQLVGVGLQILFYLTAILYPLDSLSPDLKTVVSLNPLSALISAYREVILYNRPPDITSLYYPLVIALTLLYLGYSFFKAQEKQFADYI